MSHWFRTSARFGRPYLYPELTPNSITFCVAYYVFDFLTMSMRKESRTSHASIVNTVSGFNVQLSFVDMHLCHSLTFLQPATVSISQGCLNFYHIP